MTIDADFPGGNIIFQSQEGDAVYLRQDPRDTEGWWFYWYFRVRGAEGRELRFQFTDGNVVGARGPAVSLDKGLTWEWLGLEDDTHDAFTYAFPPEGEEVRFCLGMAYLQQELDKFLAAHENDPALRRDVLCKSRKGREVELLHLGRMDGGEEYRWLLVARHHACEMMANYVLEGIMESALAQDELGAWLREKVYCLVVPFMDKDGVEEGDQGKNRRPWDHNRDYGGRSLYPEVRAVKRRFMARGVQRPDVLLDFHCPWIYGPQDEAIFWVANDTNQEKIDRLSAILQRVRTGPLPFDPNDNVPFGEKGNGWNCWEGYGGKQTFALAPSHWRNVKLVGSLEVAYANAHGVPVTAESARALGRDLALTLREFLESG